jgi:hypothetical protein
VRSASWLEVANEGITLKLWPSVVSEVARVLHKGNLRDYVDGETLVQFTLGGIGMTDHPQGMLSFTCCFGETAEEQQPVLRIVMTVDGEVYQRARYDFLPHPLAKEVMQIFTKFTGAVFHEGRKLLLNYLEKKLQPFILAVSSFFAVTLASICSGEFGRLFVTSISKGEAFTTFHGAYATGSVILVVVFRKTVWRFFSSKAGVSSVVVVSAACYVLMELQPVMKENIDFMMFRSSVQALLPLGALTFQRDIFKFVGGGIVKLISSPPRPLKPVIQWLVKRFTPKG